MKFKKLGALCAAFAIGATVLTALPASAGELTTGTVDSCDFVYSNINQTIATANDGNVEVSLTGITDPTAITEIVVNASQSGQSQAMLAIGMNVDASAGLENDWYSDSCISSLSNFTVAYDMTDIAAHLVDTSLVLQFWWAENNQSLTVNSVGVNVEGGSSGIYAYSRVKGDANGDGTLNAPDIYQSKAFVTAFTDAINTQGELNADGSVTILDTLINKRLLLGLYTQTVDPNADIRDITGLELTAEMKIGWNLGNTLDAYNSNGASLSSAAAETCWGNPITTKAMIDDIKEAGFNTVRVPTTYYNHTGSAPDYTIDTAWLDRVEEVVNYVRDNDMYCIINIHHENDWLKPNYNDKSNVEARLQKMWTQIANRFKDYDDYLIFEVMNEPRLVGDSTEWNGGTSEARACVVSYNQVALNAIRATGGNNAQRFVMVTPYCASMLSSVTSSFTLPNDSASGKLIVSIHNYSPYNFALNTNGTSNFNDSDKQQINSEFATLYNTYISKGIPVVLGECGALDKNNLSARVQWATAFFSASKQYGIPCVLWDNNVVNSSGENFGYYNRSAGNWYFPEIITAMVNAVK